MPRSASPSVQARRWPRPAPRSPTPPRAASGPAETPRPGSRSRVGRSTRRSRWCPARRWPCRPGRRGTWCGSWRACGAVVGQVVAATRCRNPRGRLSVAVAGEPAVRSSPPTARCPCSSAGCHPPGGLIAICGVIGIRDEPCSDPSFPRSVRCGLLRDALNHVQQTHQRTSDVPGCRPSLLPRLPGRERHRDRRSPPVFPTSAQRGCVATGREWPAGTTSPVISPSVDRTMNAIRAESRRCGRPESDRAGVQSSSGPL